MNRPADLHTILQGKAYLKLDTLLRKSIGFLYSLVLPTVEEENEKRHEFILNIFLLGITCLAFFAFTQAFVDFQKYRSLYEGANPEVLFIIFLFFLALYSLSRRGYHIAASYIFLIVLFLSATYSVHTWGIDLPQALLVYALIIVMSGMLIHSRFSFFLTAVISSIILLFGYWQNNSITHPNLYWKKEMLTESDALVFAATLFVISLVSWLSNREIQKSLARAIASEAALKQERDLLEIKVEERTHALKETQLQKTIELSRFAEFGQMTAGLFHDLLNPLTAVSLHLEKLKKGKERGTCMGNCASIDHIIKGVEQIRSFSENALKQVQTQEVEFLFSVAHEISSTVQMLSYKARRANVQIEFTPPPLIQTYGNPLLFYRVIMNLITNAVDSYADVSANGHDRKVKVFLSEEHGLISLVIQDFGCGIKKEDLEKVFDPLYTTKDTTKGTGLGLGICKNIIEKRFRGSIRLESEEHKGTIALAVFPKTYHKELTRLYHESQRH